MRAVNLDMAGRAILVLQIKVMLRTAWFDCANSVINAVTLQTKLSDCAGLQQPWVARSVRCVAGRASFGFDRSMLVDEWSLFVGVTLNASGIGAGREPCLFGFKSAMSVVAISTLHRAFENLVMEWLIELMLYFRVAFETKLGLGGLQKLDRRNTLLFPIAVGHERVRARLVCACLRSMRRMAIGTANVVSPVFSTTEIVVLFLAAVTCETRFRNSLCGLVLKRMDLRLVATTVDVILPRSVTRFATNNFSIPTGHPFQLGMCGVCEVLKLVFVTSFAGFAAYILLVFRLGRRSG